MSTLTFQTDSGETYPGTYSDGTNSFAGIDYRQITSSGPAVAVQIVGTGAAFYGETSSNAAGSLTVTVDGGSPLDITPATANEDSYHPICAGLEDGPHELVISNATTFGLTLIRNAAGSPGTWQVTGAAPEWNPPGTTHAAPSTDGRWKPWLPSRHERRPPRTWRARR